MTADQPPEPPLPESSKKFANLRSVRWRIDLGILPNAPTASIDDLRRVTADTRRRYVNLRRGLQVDPHLSKDDFRDTDVAMDNPLSQNPESTWGRFFKNAELEKKVGQDLSRLYPEDGSYFQTPACQSMLRKILILWCLRHPEHGYQQGMHELLAPIVYVLHVDLEHLSHVRKLYENQFNGEFDGISFQENEIVSNNKSKRTSSLDLGIDKEKYHHKKAKVCSLDDLDPDTKDIFLLSDAYGAEGELGVVLSDRFMEHDAYCMFDGLMSGADGVVAMADFFSTSATGSTAPAPVIEASSALYHFLSVADSSLHSHLVDLGVEPQYFALRWLRVLFGREFYLNELLEIWDEIFSTPNGNNLETDVEYNFEFLCSPRGAFIAALAVSMLLYVRSSLLATENATSCLQRLLNFPKNPDMKKIMQKTRSLHGLTVDSNFSSPSSTMNTEKIKLNVKKGNSLLSGPCSQKAQVNAMPDSYWEEKWSVLYKEEETQKGRNNCSIPAGTSNKMFGENSGLSRSEPSPLTNGSGSNDASSTVRRNLLDDFSRVIMPVKDFISNEQSKIADILNKTGFGGNGEKYCIEQSDLDNTRRSTERAQVLIISSDDSSLSSGLDAAKHLEDESNDHCITKNTERMVEATTLSRESSSFSSTVTSRHSLSNDIENDFDQSSVHSCVGDNDNNNSNSNSNEKLGQEQVAALRDPKPVASKFQWLLKLARVAGEGNSEKVGNGDLQRSAAGIIKDSVGTSASNVSCSCGGRRIDVDTLKKLGKSMIENIQVIETVLQQDRDSLDNLPKNSVDSERQITAMEALKKLRKISFQLSEM